MVHRWIQRVEGVRHCRNWLFQAFKENVFPDPLIEWEKNYLSKLDTLDKILRNLDPLTKISQTCLVFGLKVHLLPGIKSILATSTAHRRPWCHILDTEGADCISTICVTAADTILICLPACIIWYQRNTTLAADNIFQHTEIKTQLFCIQIAPIF